MRKLKILLIPVVSLVIIASTCKTKSEKDNMLLIENKTNKTLMGILSLDIERVKLTNFYYDQIMASEYNYRIDSFSKNRLWYIPICHETEWKRIVGSRDSAILYLIERDTLVKYNKAQELTSDKIFKRLVLTLEMLENNNCHIVVE